MSSSVLSSLRTRSTPVDPRLVLAIALRAYGLGYLTTTGPRLISFVRILLKQNVNNRDKIRHLLRILCRAFRWTSFPTFCALLAGGSALVESVLKQALSKNGALSQKSIQAIRFVSILCTSWLCFPLLNSKHRPESKPNEIRQQQPEPGIPDAPSSGVPARFRSLPPSELAGRTLDLTLFATTRAMDVIACSLWKRWKDHRKSRNKWTYLESIIPQLGDTALFAASSAVIMWAWFYLPEKLPYSYGRWIGEAAQIDKRLIEALRSCRRAEWTYGKPKGDLEVLESMCRDYGFPEEWGDPSKTVPIPCELVHMGCGPSCEKHALWRFAKAFAFSSSTYFPLQLILKLRSRSVHAYVKAAKAATRSSTFLALFITLFYYSVCLARTRLGPKLFSYERVTPMMWDSGLCVGAGCVMCGWSILVESAAKRREVALFVAPRAAATLLPRRYERKYLWRENLAFALSTAIVLTSVQSNPKTVRGVLGKVLGIVYK
ncbi:hypothetical protein VTO42DRAFT_1786 [Malbranchea cinnamomea]